VSSPVPSGSHREAAPANPAGALDRRTGMALDLSRLLAPSPRRDAGSVGLRVAAAGLLAGTAGIHLDLYLTGYRHVPTIGVLFVFQAAACLATALALVALDRPIVHVTGALLAASTLGGYVLSRAVGLFGFREVATTSGAVAGALELGALVACGALVARADLGPVRPIAATAGLAVVAGAVLLGFYATPGPPRDHTVGAAASAGAAGSSSGTKALAHGVTVTIVNFAFAPARFTVSPGERVTILNKDGVAHTFTAMPGAGPSASFNSGPIEPGGTKSVLAPTTAGTYPFYCSIHPFMTGAMTVAG